MLDTFARRFALVLAVAAAIALASCQPDKPQPPEPPGVSEIHVGVLVAGLGSSLPGIGDIWFEWVEAQMDQIAASTSDRSDIELHGISSDISSAEEEAYERVVELHTAGRLGVLFIAGHSNGFRDALSMAAKLGEQGIEVDYFAGIDMTLGPFGARVTCNIKQFDEFHATLLRAKFAEGCSPEDMDYVYHKLTTGHTAAANSNFVQQTMHDTFLELINDDGALRP